MNKVSNSYSCSVIDILRGIANLTESHIKHKIGGDFHFDFVSNRPGCILFNEFMRVYKPKFCDTLNDTTVSNIFTYCHAFLNRHSFVDNCLVDSASYCDVVNCSIDDSGTNLYDHSAVLLSIKMSTHIR